MVTHSVHNFPVGTFVESRSANNNLVADIRFIGTVTGLTVNMFGEPVLLVHMTCRRTTTEKNMRALGWKPVAHDSTETFWERTGPMHPSNVQRLGETSFLGE